MVYWITASALVALVAALTAVTPFIPTTLTTPALAESRRPYVPARPEAMGEWPSMITLAGPWKYHTDPRVGAQAHRPEHDDRNWPTTR